MNLPRGTLTTNEKWENGRPIDYLSRVDLDFSGVIRFFERGEEWNVFFLLIENGLLIGYYTIKGNDSLEEKLHSLIEQCEVEVRTFSSSELKIAQDINEEYLLSEPIRVSDVSDVSAESKAEVTPASLFPDESFVEEIKKAKKFREDFLQRRISETSN